MKYLSARLAMMVALGLLCGCASTGPIAPLVPLPDHMMPSRDQLVYRPWRVVISPTSGRYGVLEQTFSAELKQQLAKYGILNVSTDARTTQMLQQMLRVQVQSGEDIRVSDLQYEVASADGLVSVTVTAMTVPKRNAATSWYDKSKKKNRYIYNSQVDVSGHLTLVIPETGMARTIQFQNSQTQTSYDKPHQFSPDQMAHNAARQAARSSRIIRPLYTQFPLTGHVIGVGETAREILINRGSNQGVRRDRKWELLMRTSRQNALMGEMVSDQVVGIARTVRVFGDSCVAKCDSRQTRARAKLGMRARAQGFGFSFAGLFGLE
ncbi:MAG: hypothetical protein ISS31_05225 [Kiritimatiellae bacterium]|nr:hypothetical protein [Kiritimatiellia bacterium]